MRDSSFSRSSFCEQLNLNLRSVPKLVENLRRAVVDNPNSLREGQNFHFRNKSKTLREWIILSIIMWWMPPEILCLTKLDLEQKVKRLSLEDQGLISQFLSSKEKTLLFLLETQLWHTRDFYGNLLKDVEKVITNLSVFYYNRMKVKYPQRKRGYHDHGSRVPDEKWLPKSDYSLTAMQWKQELERKTLTDTLAFIEGLIT